MREHDADIGAVAVAKEDRLVGVRALEVEAKDHIASHEERRRLKHLENVRKMSGKWWEHA